MKETIRGLIIASIVCFIGVFALSGCLVEKVKVSADKVDTKGGGEIPNFFAPTN
tara:strand:- start:202 stop:363 length:162 start_codon:yes stop_codon:yes gene_type:complete